MANTYFCDQQIIMFEFLKTLLIIIWVFYALKLVVRWIFPRVLPWLMQQMVKKAVKRQQSNETDFRVNTPKEKPTKSHSKKVVGEYIDFEEIED